MTTDHDRRFGSWWTAHRGGVVELIRELVAIDTSEGREAEAYAVVGDVLTRMGVPWEVHPAPPGLAEHPLFTPRQRVEGASHLLAEVEGALPGAPTTIVNTHVDVVPAGPGYLDAYSPVLVGDRVHGRGACDSKGNVAMLLAALAYCLETGRPLRRRLRLALVAEEEVGGNGTLAAILSGQVGDEAVVLEPTGLSVHHGHRGCLSWRADVTGSPTHMGGAEDPVNAIVAAAALVDELQELERRLLEEARRQPDFAGWERPLQLNVGRIEGGEWLGSVPAACVVEGNLGFLPPLDPAGAAHVLREHVEAARWRWPGAAIELTHPLLRNGAYALRRDHPLVLELQRCRAAAGLAPEPQRAWNVSCDARYYPHLLGVPAVIFGAGTLAEAHSNDEYVDMDQVRAGSAVLVALLLGAGAT
ncbi:MAG TPA: M20/M25/M40 family metallo-hydrolase [Candidatus Dormibacteraeota bacterium]|nr:M20/M25/M40 family metallo-hydrolase [Candidatus Dormibacteraeota bacterium]